MVYKNFSTFGTTTVEPDVFISPTLENDKKRSAPRGHWQRFKNIRVEIISLLTGKKTVVNTLTSRETFNKFSYSHGNISVKSGKISPFNVNLEHCQGVKHFFSVQNLANASGNTIYIHRLKITDNELTPSQKVQFNACKSGRQAVDGHSWPGVTHQCF